LIKLPDFQEIQHGIVFTQDAVKNEKGQDIKKGADKDETKANDQKHSERTLRRIEMQRAITRIAPITQDTTWRIPAVFHNLSRGLRPSRMGDEKCTYLEPVNVMSIECVTH
jgi:hypothetical protein